MCFDLKYRFLVTRFYYIFFFLYLHLSVPFQKHQSIMNRKKLYGRKIKHVTIKDLLQMASGIEEYDNNFVREYQNTHRADDLSPVWILNQRYRQC